MLPEIPEHNVLRAPSVAIDGDTVFIAANLFRGDSVVGPSVYLGRLHRTVAGVLLPLDRLALPPGDFQFAYPRVVARGGRLHLVWAELASRWKVFHEWATPANGATTLWHAVREHGVWSPPERIAGPSWFGWNTEVGGVALEASGTLHVAVHKSDEGTFPRVYDYRWSGDHWDSAQLPYLPLAGSATAIVARGDTVAIALMDRLDDTSHVIVIASRDHGATWTAPLVTSQRPHSEGRVARLALAAAADGLLLAVGEQPQGDTSLDTLRVFWLTGGLNTASKRLVDLPPSVDGFDLVAGPCGAGVLLLRTFSMTPRLYTATLTHEASRPIVRPLLPGRRALFPAMAADRGTAVAVFVDFPTDALLRNVALALPVCPP